MNLRPRFLVPALAAAAVLASCGGQGVLDASEIRLVNATADAAPLELYASSDRIVRDVGPYAASSFEELESDAYDLRVVRSGVTAASLDGDLEEDRRYTVLVTAGDGAMAARLITEDEDEPDSGFARLRFLNAAGTRAGALDVFLIAGNCAELETSTVAPVAANLTGMQSGWSQVAAAGSGTPYHLCVTSSSDRGDVRLDLPAYTLNSRQVVTFVIGETPGGVLLEGGSLVQGGAFTAHRATQARVRLVNGRPSGGGDVTATVGAAALGTAVGREVRPYRLVPSGNPALEITGASPPDPVPPLQPGSDSTLLVTSAGTSYVIADDNRPSVITARPVRIRLVNGIAGLPAAALLTVNSATVGNAARAGETSGYTSVEASTTVATPIEVTSNGTVLCQSNANLSGGRVYTVWLLGAPTTPAPACRVLADR